MSDQHQQQQLSANPFLTLAVAFISQLCAGTLYWFPAITPGIAAALNLSESQSTYVTAIANSGSLLGIFGGLFNERYGSRLTAALSALGVALCYLTLGLLTMFASFLPLNNTIIYAIVLFFSVFLTTVSYPLYSSSIAASVSVFPLRYRGRVVGLNVITYGGAAGIHTAIQSVFFPTRADTPANLVFVAFCGVVIALTTYLVYPQNALYDVEEIVPPVSNAEELPLQQSSNVPIYDNYISSRLSIAYRIAIVLLVSLQIAAFSNIMSVPKFVQVIIMILVVGSLLSMLWIPVISALRVFSVPQTVQSSAHNEKEENYDNNTTSMIKEPSLLEAMTDVRGIYIEAGCAVLVGAGGMFLLVQSFYIVDALQYGPGKIWSNIDSVLAVRMIVALFVACSVTGRLIMGATLDRGETPSERIILAFQLMRLNFLLMAVSMLALAVPSELIVLLGVIGIGFAYGAFFTVSPTLTTLWFGVRTFPRNFAVFGGFVVLASFTVNSTISAFIRNQFGTWRNVGTLDAPKIICGGTWCILPTLLPSVCMQILMYIVGGFLYPIVRKRLSNEPF